MLAAKEPGPREAPSSDERYVFLRELGRRTIPTYAALLRLPEKKPLLVVAERMPRDGRIGDEDAAAIVRLARAGATLHHANVVSTRDVSVRADDVIVASDFLDGELLSSLWETRSTRPPLALCVRVILDVLTGLDALHEHRDPATRAPLDLVHGDLTAASVLVGVDGVARVLRACRIRPARIKRVPATNTVAPEVLSGKTLDRRADVFSAGAILWESLSEDARWATPLADVATRAMSVAPEKRYPTAAAMADEIRQIVGAKMMSSGRVAMLMNIKIGERVAQRLEALVDASTSPSGALVLPAPEPAPPAPSPPPPRAPFPTPPPVRNSEPMIEHAAIPMPTPAAARRGRSSKAVVAALAGCGVLVAVTVWRAHHVQAPPPTTQTARASAAPPMPIELPTPIEPPAAIATSSANVVAPSATTASPLTSDAPRASTSATSASAPTPTTARPLPRTPPPPRRFDPTRI